MLLIKLILREAWYHRSRLTLAVIATAAMSAMLVWLVGSIGLVVLQFDNVGEKYLGHYHVTMIPQRGDEAGPERPMPPMPMMVPLPVLVEPKVLDELRSNDLVMQVTPARQIRGAFVEIEIHDGEIHGRGQRSSSSAGRPRNANGKSDHRGY